MTNPGRGWAPAPSTLTRRVGRWRPCTVRSVHAVPAVPPSAPASPHTAHTRLQAPPRPVQGRLRGRRLRVCPRVHVPTRTSQPKARWLGNAHSQRAAPCPGPAPPLTNHPPRPLEHGPLEIPGPGSRPRALHRCPGPASEDGTCRRSPGLTRARSPLLTPRADGVHAPA